MSHENKVAELCPEGYIYCAVPKGRRFPDVKGVPREWYDHQEYGHLEFRKYVNDGKCKECGNPSTKNPYTPWMVTPVLYLPHPIEDEVKRFPEFEMKDQDVLMLWMVVTSREGCVSDGYINLFSG